MLGGDDDRFGNDGQAGGESHDIGHEPVASHYDEATYNAEAEAEADRLAFNEEERLPWLEADDEYTEYEGSDTGRILGFVILGLIALAAIVGGIWWATHRTPDPALVADGSTIEAPEQPYKEAPKDPGGKTFDGTGDTSFAVSEGQTRPARLGQAGASGGTSGATAAATPAATGGVGAAKPGVDAGSAKPAAAPSAAGGSAPAGGVGVQVGAFSSQASAEAAWSRLVQAHSVLSGVRHRVVEGKADIGTVYRLQAVPGDAAAANALCGRLKAGGLACQVKQ
jgi:hypothetical protein